MDTVENNQSMSFIKKLFGYSFAIIFICFFGLWCLTGATPLDTLRNINGIISAPISKPEVDKNSLEKTTDKISKFAES
ncbi:TPA: hypothetical protein MW242_003451 [Acinetobacter baumannii]|nr:hypothetical protein [Acinetobacter baumannii]